MNAANDENFYQIRNRTLPIRSSITSIPNYPTKLVIFLTNASCYWQVRCFFNGKTIIRSLRTTSKKDAIRYAKDFYNTKICVASSQQNIGFTRTHSIEFTSSLLLQAEKARVDRGEVAKHSHTMLISRIR